MAENPPSQADPENDVNLDDQDSASEGTPSRFGGLLPLVLGILLIAVLMPWMLWYMIQEKAPDSYEKLQMALEALENKQFKAAANGVIPLQNEMPPDPRMGGGVEYVIGMVAFRDAQLERTPVNKVKYEMAISFLKEAHRKSLDAEHLDRWTLAMGLSLYRVGRLSEAIPYLQTVFDQNQITSSELSFALADCYLNPNTVLAKYYDLSEVEQEIEKKKQAAVCNEAIFRTPSTSPQLIRDARKQQIQIAIVQDKGEEALQLLEQFQKDFPQGALLNSVYASEQVELSLYEGRVAFRMKDYPKAIQIFDRIVSSYSYTGRVHSRQASFFLAQSYEAINDIDKAIKQYKQVDVIDKSYQHNENMIALIRRANLLRRHKDQHERALNLYLRALDMISQDDFKNPWIRLDDLKKQYRVAWDEWVKTKNYSWSIQLSTQLVPLFSQDQTDELTALATLRWAEQLQKEFNQSTETKKRHLQKKLLEHWVRAGDAYARLAHSRRTTGNYPEAIWESAKMYQKGHDFKKAIYMVNKFIRSEPKNLLPTAMVLKGRLLMNLDVFEEEDRLEEAIQIFKRVIRDYHTDQTAYTAQLLMGDIYLEQGKTDLAISVWEEILSSTSLSPAAQEWRQALFLVGKTLFLVSEQKKLEQQIAQAKNKVDDVKQFKKDRESNLTNAIRRLEEYLQRVTKFDSPIEAEWLLARALRAKAEFPMKNYHTAETDNARLQLQQDAENTLASAMKIYDQLRKDLKQRASEDRLNALELLIYKDAFFEPGHIFFTLGVYDDTGKRYQKAIDQYRNAINHFGHSPRVLLAYYQMANCYDRLKRPSEARSQLEQAKVILQQLPKEKFTPQTSNYSHDEWNDLLNRAIQIQQANSKSKTFK